MHLVENQSRDPHITTRLQILYSNNLMSTFPNTSIALRIFFTLPVTVESGERSFSKLKLIK